VQADPKGGITSDAAWDCRLSLGETQLCFSGCERVLQPDVQQRIVATLQEAMPAYNIRQYFERQPTIFSDYHALVVAVRDDRALGILGGKWFDLEERRIFYVWTAFVGDEHRGRRLFGEMMGLLLGAGSDSFPDLLSLKTFNPRVYQLIAPFGRVPGVRFYPRLADPVQDPAMVDLAIRALRRMFPKLSLVPEIALVPGGQQSVGIEVFPNMPRAADPVVRAHFEKHVTAADQIFVILETPDPAKPAVREAFLSRCPRVAELLRERRVRSGEASASV
jgi:hypothetical protein